MVGSEDSLLRDDTKQTGVNAQAEVQAAPEILRSPKEKRTESAEGHRENRSGAAKVIWLLALLTALLCASSLINITISKKVYESSQRNAEAVLKLNKSLQDLQQSVARLTQAIEEPAEPEEEGEGPALTPAWGTHPGLGHSPRLGMAACNPTVARIIGEGTPLPILPQELCKGQPSS
jgi:hypothetical protein